MSRQVTSTGTRLAIALAAVTIMALSASRLWLLPTHFSANPNEGWNAFQAARAFGAGPLYPSPSALTGNNYPPLSFYIVGGLGRVVGDPIIAGRIVSLASILIVAACIFTAVERFVGACAAPASAAGVAPAVGALIFLGFNATEFRAYVAMNDPQWLAHALMTAGFVLLIPREPGRAPAAPRVAAAALLTVAGGLVKHNLVALPLAATLWLALHHRRAFAIWAATGATALGLAAAACGLLYGPDAFADVFLAARHASWVRMLRVAALPVLAVAPLVVASATLWRARKADPRCDLLLLAVGLGVPLGALQRSGQGVYINAHFEALIAVSIAAAVAVSKSPPAKPGAWMSVPASLVLTPFLVLLATGARSEVKEVAGRRAAQAAWTAMEASIAATPGPVACETPSLCYWAHKDFGLDVFLYGQRVLRTRDASALIQALGEHRFAAVQMDSPKIPKAGDAANPLYPLIASRSDVTFEAADGRRLLTPK